MKKLLLLIMLWMGYVGSVQAQYFRVLEHRETHSSKEVYTFPLLQLSAGASIANQINAFLQKEELDTTVTPNMKGAFAHLWPVEGEMQGTTDYHYRILANNERFFGVEFRGEGCGAYCESYTKTYFFDSSTGQHLTTKELFTEAGLAFFDKAVRLQRINAIKKQIAKLKKELQDKPKDPDIAEMNPEAIEMYNQCIEFKRDLSHQETDYDDLYLADATPTSKATLALVGGRCSNHASMALDDLGNPKTEFQLGTIQLCLSARAIKLLRLPAVASNRKQQQLSGTINQTIKIHLLLESSETSSAVSGVYFYDNFGIPIPLRSNQAGKGIELMEENEKGEPTAKFQLTLTGNALRGQWTDLKKNKSFPVALTLMK